MEGSWQEMLVGFKTKFNEACHIFFKTQHYSSDASASTKTLLLTYTMTLPAIQNRIYRYIIYICNIIT